MRGVRLVARVLLPLLLAWPCFGQDKEQDTQLTFLVGGTVSVGADAKAAIEPYGELSGHIPVAIGNKEPFSLHSTVRFLSLPGASATAPTNLDLQAFKAIDFAAAIERAIGDTAASRTEVALEGKVVTRLPGQPGPVDKTVKASYLFLKFIRKGGGEVDGGIGFTQEAGLDDATAFTVRAHVPISGQNGIVVLGGDWIYPFAAAPWNYISSQGRYGEIVRIWTAVNIGATAKKLAQP